MNKCYYAKKNNLLYSVRIASKRKYLVQDIRSDIASINKIGLRYFGFIDSILCKLAYLKLQSKRIDNGPNYYTRTGNQGSRRI